jgi:hypothetical protein
MDFNIFGSTPEYYSGLLGQEATDKLKKRATGTGIANALLALVAQPRNQGYGSALPYIGKALMAGQQAGQNVVEGGLRDFDVQQRIAEMKRKQEQQQAQQQFIQRLPENQRDAALAFPELGAKVAETMAIPQPTAQLLTPEEQMSFGLGEAGRFQRKADGTFEQVSGTAPQSPSSVQEYNFARQQGYGGSFNDFLQMKKPAGTVVNVGQGGVAPRKIDEKFADQFIDWTVGGGFSDVQKSLTQLEGAISSLENSPEGSITGKAIGVTPPDVLKLANPQAVATKEAVEEIVQRNLRLILGAQFTEKEGERLIARAYNPALSQKENARRGRLLQEQIFEAAKAKQDAVDYYNQNGTIFGWQGRMFNNTNDFLNEYDKRLKGKETPASTSTGGFKIKRIN